MLILVDWLCCIFSSFLSRQEAGERIVSKVFVGSSNLGDKSVESSNLKVLMVDRVDRADQVDLGKILLWKK